jgi:4-amino-4-deoxy-L-arabinose transferase-like glycosyltransferase
MACYQNSRLSVFHDLQDRHLLWHIVAYQKCKDGRIPLRRRIDCHIVSPISHLLLMNNETRLKEANLYVSAKEAQHPKITHPQNWVYLAVLCIALLAYLFLSVGSAISKAPWEDEGFLTGIAYNLKVNGVLGSPTLEPAGLGYVRLPSVDQFTYWHMPLYFLADACLGLFGDLSPLGIRALSVIAGLFALAAFHLCFYHLTGRWVGLLATVMLATSYTFVKGGSTARMDMLGACFAALSYASYLSLRTRTLYGALLSANGFVVAAGLTHPIAGLISFPTLLCLVARFDWSRLRSSCVVLSTVPYLVGGIAWLWYILRAPSVFLMQFGANLEADGRTGILSSPFMSLLREITVRYASLAGFTSPGTLPRARLVIVLTFAMCVLASVAIPTLRQNRAHFFLLGLVVVQAITLAMIDGRKEPLYLVNTVPLLVALTAATLSALALERLMPRWVVTTWLSVFVLINTSGSIYLTLQNDYARSYKPAVDFIQQRAAGARLIFAGSEIGLGLGFPATVREDIFFGFESGKIADWIVLSSLQRNLIETGSFGYGPDGLQHRGDLRNVEGYVFAKTLLETRYVRVYEGEDYEIYHLVSNDCSVGVQIEKCQ